MSAVRAAGRDSRCQIRLRRLQHRLSRQCELGAHATQVGKPPERLARALTMHPEPHALAGALDGRPAAATAAAAVRVSACVHPPRPPERLRHPLALPRAVGRERDWEVCGRGVVVIEREEQTPPIDETGARVADWRRSPRRDALPVSLLQRGHVRCQRQREAQPKAANHARVLAALEDGAGEVGAAQAATLASPLEVQVT